MPARRLLVTAALPYANGAIHLGHMVEHVQTDIWVRYQRMQGHDVVFICASDAHGTPAMLSARREGVTPEALTERYRAEHQRDFARFLIEYDNYHTTHSPENRTLVEAIYARLVQRNLIARRTVRQAYDAEAGMFLPDRFVRGTCPVCKSPDQYGDSCEVCGATYSPSDLIEPRSVLSGTPPVQRDSEHLFFRLGEFEQSLKRWHAAGHVHASVARKLEEWFSAGLRDWDISRDAPYFGFKIPGTDDKYFYVWLDAPVGYMASFRHYCDSPAGRARGLDFNRYWQPAAGSEPDTELWHFIGKDIAYFHTLFWPALLEAAGYRRPSGVFVHGFLTVNGEKMSKSRGTFIAAATYADHLAPEHLRYYFASKLGPGIDDIDLNLEDFSARVNADLVGKFVNVASRCAGFITRDFGGELAPALESPDLYRRFSDAAGSIGELIEAREYAKALREVMALADLANRYVDERKPWVLARDPARRAEVQAVCTQGLNLFRVLMTYLKPVLPGVARQAEEFLNAGQLDWSSPAQPLLGTRIQPYQPLLVRVDPAAVTRMVEASMEKPAPVTAPPAAAATTSAAREPAQIEISDFQKLDLRVATVLAAESVEGSDKLVRLRLDIGAGERSVLSGIRSAYAPEQLVGRQVILIVNLKPRKMRFGTSEGMVLSAGGESGLYLLSADAGAKAGMKIS